MILVWKNHCNSLLVKVHHLLDPVCSDSMLEVTDDTLAPPLWFSGMVSGDSDGFSFIIEFLCGTKWHSGHGFRLVLDLIAGLIGSNVFGGRHLICLDHKEGDNLILASCLTVWKLVSRTVLPRAQTLSCVKLHPT